ncbi:MAG TPA: YggT family protein [Acidimicrobiales bacterium]|nr:YggT family protein [Acidimicrobiales bacterium]
MSIAHIIAYLLELYVIILIVRALLSWVPVQPDSGFAKVVAGLDRITEPVLRPVRRILPPIRAGGMGIDLSVLIVVIVVQVVLVPILLSR